MLENERPHLVHMALGALLIFETTETKPFCGLMRVVARRAFHHAFFEAVALVERKLGDRRGMTLRAFLGRPADGAVRRELVDEIARVHRMAALARQPGPRVRASLAKKRGCD